LRELGAGFVICEGLSDQVEEVRVSKNEIRVYAKTDASAELSAQRKVDYELRASGCIGVRGLPKIVVSTLMITKAEVFHVIQQVESGVWKKTGGVHCSVLFQDGQLLVRSSDIGRHNTIDKIVGFAVLNGIDLSQCTIGCTGRQPAGMIAKVANAGVPIIVSKAAATDAGILLADRSNVTLVCFARGERFTVYSHPERIAGLVKE
jgi:FdhD protein